MNKRGLTTLAAVCIVSIAISQEKTRTQAVTEILVNNLSLKALAHEHKAEAIELNAAGRLTSQPEVEYEHLFSGGEKKWNIGVTQSFDWPDVYRRRKQEADKRIGAFTYLYAAEQRRVAREAMQLLDNAVYVHKQLRLSDLLIDNITTLKQKISTAYDHGQVTLLDVKKLDFELYTLTAKRADLEQESDNITAQLTALNGGTPLSVDIAEYAPQQLLAQADYKRIAVEDNPTVKASLAMADAQRLASRTAAAERLPGFSIGYRHAYEERTHFNGFAIGLSLPVFTTKSASVAADTRALAVEFDAGETIAALNARIDASYADVLRRGAALKEMAKVALDNKYPELLLMAYNGGQINVITYLQELGYFQSARSEYLTAEYNYVVSLTDLNALLPRE